MNFPEAVIVIVAIVTAGRVLSGGRWAARRRERRGWVMPEDAAVLPEQNDALKAEVRRLNERIAVLEKIATDPGKRLSDEIDALPARRER